MMEHDISTSSSSLKRLNVSTNSISSQNDGNDHEVQDNVEIAEQSEKEKGSRSRDGCLTCKARKVKCNEIKPICDKCRIKSRDCIWPEGDADQRRRNKKRRKTTTTSASVEPAPLQIEQAPQPHSHNYSHSKVNFDGFPNLASVPSTSGAQSTSVRGESSKKQNPSNANTNANEPKKNGHVPQGFLRTSILAQGNGNGKGNKKGKEKEKEVDFTRLLVPDRSRAEMMMDPSFLQAYFPTVDERLVIRHYLSRTVHIILAFESPHHPWNPWISVHAPLAFNHLPGVLPAADALRTAILAVGGVHLHYSNGSDQAAAWKITKAAKTKVLYLIRQTLEGPDGTRKTLSQEEIELILAALLSCTIASSLAADDSWHHLLSTVLSLIEELGGAQHILQDAPRDKLSPYRFFMEQLAIRDVFGCMTTELAPTILQDAFTPWFFEAEGWSGSDMEWESVDRMFGISRGMVDLIARACTLIAAVRARGKPFSEDEHDQDEGGSPATSEYNTNLQATASGLMAELKVWDEAENFTPLHPRTQYGNHSYRHAIRIRILRKVYNVSSKDERVVKSSMAIIELAKELLALYGKITWLTWPILIAGFEIPPEHPSRQTALDMLGAFGPHACFDNRAGARMLSDYWTWHDIDGDHATSWELAQILNQRPFLD